MNKKDINIPPPIKDLRSPQGDSISSHKMTHVSALIGTLVVYIVWGLPFMHIIN